MKRIVFLASYVLAIIFFSISNTYAETQKSDETFIPNTISDIADDGDYLWLASDSGLVKFNKLSEELIFYTEDNSDIPSDNTRSVEVVGEEIWVGTNLSGIGVFNGSAWDSLTVSNSDLPSNLSIKDISLIQADVWVAAAPSWICQYSNNQWNNYSLYETDLGSSFEAVYTLVKNLTGTIWAGSKEGLYYLENNSFSRLEQVPQDDVYSIVVASDSTIWFSCGETGLYAYKNGSLEIFNTDTSDIPSNGVFELAVDYEGTLWISTYSMLVTYDGIVWQTYTADDFAMLETIGPIHCDNEGFVWIGTNGNGLIRFDGETWTQYDIIPSITAVEKSETPTAIDLLPAYPNPFNPQTTISYTLHDKKQVTIAIYDVLGRCIRTLIQDVQVPAGSHSIIWDGRDDVRNTVASGVYICRIVAGASSLTRKITLMR